MVVTQVTDRAIEARALTAGDRHDEVAARHEEPRKARRRERVISEVLEHLRADHQIEAAEMARLLPIEVEGAEVQEEKLGFVASAAGVLERSWGNVCTVEDRGGELERQRLQQG